MLTMIYEGTGFPVLVSLLIIALAILYLQGNRGPLPPGPPRLPIVGNLKYLTVLGKPRPWHLFYQFAQQYGPLTYLELLGKPVVIISSAKAATELLDRRASNYSRPHMVVGGEYLSGNLNFAISNGDIWRRMRRASQAQLGVKTLIRFQDIQTDEGVLFAYEMLTQPEKRKENILRVTASVILSILYDQPPLRSLDDPSVRLMDKYADKMHKAAQPGTYLVEILPVLKYLPTFFAPWKKSAKKDFQAFSSMFLRKYEVVKDRMLSGEQRPSLCAMLTESASRHELNDLESAWAAAILYGTAYDSTSASLAWFFLIMIQFPHIQRKAQEEIDTVIGRSRLPSFSDMDHLPYICALIREMLRWRPPAPFGVVYQSVKDDYFDGQIIPGGSLCIPNIWTINRDPQIYGADANEFRPERHLTPDGKRLKDEKEESHFTFGFGKRICIGRYFANKALFIDITMILWGMSIKPSPNDSGQIVIPSTSEDVGEGFISLPPPFECRCEPRFAGVEATLKQAHDAVLLGHMMAEV
ncbi:hypothetical protein D9758_006938 [Tetrapyrgos nigripes]|uniref:Cytochrome P450 n=1 Tax=Tetrapyrgos nigripes TaxID=182062 RepID=A0A8H5GSD3_9AGAR|nr:hypothetical protein D9758_006938 [Tetrapyrgos nigripes]